MILLLAMLLQSDIAVQHEGRVKPFDAYARQLVQFLSEREGPDPVATALELVRDPRAARTRKLIKITHPEMLRRLRLTGSLFSLDDLEPVRAALLAEAADIDEETATSRERAVLKVVHQFMTVDALSRGQLAIVPVLRGPNRAWTTLAHLRAWAAGTPDAELDAHEDTLREALASWEAGRYEGLAERLRSVNPEVYPTAKRIGTEMLYNRARPFHRASAAYFVAALAFLMALVFASKRAWWAAMAIHAGALGLTVWGYALRWIISGRYPLSNHYESMIMCALGAALLAPVLDVALRTKGVMGLGGSVVAFLLLVLANNVPTFAEQGFVAPLVPALQSVWMTLHVPIIMTGYAMGMLLTVLGHIHLVRVLRGRDDESLDPLLYRVLQLTALFLLIGIILGAVWAGEAWGRPWGWDMKETWALITLLAYLAMLHARFLGALRAFGTSIASLIAFQVLILTYYGVNFLFGKGLHTYGFGSGEAWPLAVFFGLEALFAGVCALVRARRSPGRPPAAERDIPLER